MCDVHGQADRNIITTSFLAHFSAYFHFCRKRDDGDTRATFNTSVNRLVYVPGIAGRQRAEDDQKFTRRMGGQVTERNEQRNHRAANIVRFVPHASTRHLNRILQTRFTNGLHFMSICNGFQHFLRITCKVV